MTTLNSGGCETPYLAFDFNFRGVDDGGSARARFDFEVTRVTSPPPCCNVFELPRGWLSAPCCNAFELPRGWLSSLCIDGFALSLAGLELARRSAVLPLRGGVFDFFNLKFNPPLGPLLGAGGALALPAESVGDPDLFPSVSSPHS